MIKERKEKKLIHPGERHGEGGNRNVHTVDAGMQPRHPKHEPSRTHVLSLSLSSSHLSDGIARRKIGGGGGASHRSVGLGQIDRRVA